MCQQAAGYDLQVYYNKDPRESTSNHQGPYYAKLQAYSSSTDSPAVNIVNKVNKAPSLPQQKAPKVNSYNKQKPKLLKQKKVVKNPRPKSSEEDVESKETFYKNFKKDKDSQELEDSVEHDDYSADLSSENYSSEHKQLKFPLASNNKKGPVLSFVKTDKGSYNWAIRYPAYS